MEWWGWLVIYASIGAVVAPLDVVYTYKFEDMKPENVLANERDEIARIKKAAAENVRWCFLCIPFWPIWVGWITVRAVGSSSNSLAYLVAAKDIARLENSLAQKKADAISAQYRKECPDTWQKEFEGQS